MNTADSTHAATFTVTNTGDSGAGSIRQAILDANETPGTDTIAFNIGSGGIQTISLTGALPRISEPVIIDGTTQPGYSGNPIVNIAGGSSGLVIDAGNSTIRGLCLRAVSIYTNGGNRIENSFIGTTVSGLAPRSDGGQGILIFNSSNNIIGGTTADKRNIISGNLAYGINVNGNSSGNVFKGNYIGVDVNGFFALPNDREGICLCSSGSDFSVSNNIIGGAEPGAGNVIAANRADEIAIQGLVIGNVVKGNLIGTRASGTAVLESTGDGIDLDGGHDNIIGGTEPGAGNVIAGTNSASSLGEHGINVERSSANIIQGNFIGTDKTGTISLKNAGIGIIMSLGQNNVIGGIAPGAGNIIAFNERAGIYISTSSSIPVPTLGNSVRGNSFFSNGGIGIDLNTDSFGGVNTNDPCDADTGANNLQNYPVITSAGKSGSTINLRGTLNSTANSTFAIDFYSSPTADASNYGEGKTYLATVSVTTDNNCNAAFNSVFPFSGTEQFITATATDAAANTSEFSLAVPTTISLKSMFDYDGDGRADLSVFRPSAGSWYRINSTNNAFIAVQFGAAGDLIAPADYDGDGKTDISVFRPTDGGWYRLNSSNNTFSALQFGSDGDLPVPGDFDGDTKADITVYRPSAGSWYRINSSNNQFVAAQFGVAEDKPLVGDFDGDGKSDLAVFRPSNGTWYRINSSNNTFSPNQFGAPNDKPVAADYDGDGKTDLAVFRPSVGDWYIINSNNNAFTATHFGISEDKPSPADFDGDGKADLAVFRPSSGTWYLLRTTAGFTGVQFGAGEDLPTPNAFIR